MCYVLQYQIHFFYKNNFIRTVRLKLGKNKLRTIKAKLKIKIRTK